MRKYVRRDLRRIVLDTVAAASVISVGLVAPNAIGAMVKLGLLPTKRQKDSIRAARNNLVRQGLLRYDNGKLRLTARRAQVGTFTQRRTYIFKTTQWDKRWRVLIFDIPEKRRGVREKYGARFPSSDSCVCKIACGYVRMIVRTSSLS